MFVRYMTLAVFALALPVAFSFAENRGSNKTVTTPNDTNLTDIESEAFENERKQNRLREGTEIVDKIGSFSWSGDRLTYLSDDGEQQFRVLENLMMERIVQTMENSSGRIHWKVSGKITEFRGNNFLLLQHVVLKGRK